MTDFARLLGALHGGGVDCIVVGGLAATIHGSARLTQDVDVSYARSEANLERVVRALGPLEPYLRGAPPGPAVRVVGCTAEGRAQLHPDHIGG